MLFSIRNTALNVCRMASPCSGATSLIGTDRKKGAIF